MSGLRFRRLFVPNAATMVVSYRHSECLFAFVGILYACLLFENVISASANKPSKVHSSVVYVHAKPANASSFEKERQLFARRHRRRLPNESSNDQLNSLDSDNGLQFQEYQGVFGRPGIDFPVLSNIPVTKFNCRNVKHSNTGYYADLETHCQVFHVCDSGRKVSFLCPNGTIFRQSHLICDWWFRVECERSPELYEQSVQQLEADQHVYKQRAETISNAMQTALSQGAKNAVMLESPVSVTNKLNDVFNSESDLPSARPEPIFTAGSTSPQPQPQPRTTTPFNPNDFTQFNGDFGKSVNSQPTFDDDFVDPASSARAGFTSQGFATPSTNAQFYSPVTPDRAQSGFNAAAGSPPPPLSQNQPSSFNRPNANAGSTFSRPNTNADFGASNSNPTPRSTFNYSPTFTASPPRDSFEANPTPSTGAAFSNIGPSSLNSQPPPANYQPASNPQTSPPQNYANYQKAQPRPTPNPAQVTFNQNTNVQSTKFNSIPPQVNPNQNVNFNSPPRTASNQNSNVQSATFNAPPPPRAFNQNAIAPSTNFNSPPRFNYDQPSSSPTPARGSNFASNPSPGFGAPARPGNYPNPAPARGSFASGSKPPSSLNSISPLRNGFTTEQKTTSSKFSAASPPRNSVNPLRTTGNYSPAPFGSTTVSPRSTVSVTAPPRSSYSAPSPTLPVRTPPRSSYSPTATPATRPATGTTSPITRSQQTQPFPSFTTTASAGTNPESYFREQQILAETAAFAGNGKYPPFSNFYYPPNYVASSSSKSRLTDATLNQPEQTTQLVDFTTVNSFDSLFDFNPQNYTNETYALYFPSEDNAINLLSLITTTNEGVTDATRENVSRPAVSEFLLNALPTDSRSADTTTQEPADHTIPVLLTNQTREGYDQLFPPESSTGKSGGDLKTEFSNGLVQSSSPKTLPSAESLNEKLKFKSSPDFRELAQIFSRALSAYLEDPEQFRKILSEVRPTEPPSVDALKNERPDDEVLAFSEDERTTARAATTLVGSSPAIRNPETFAEEINNFMIDPFTGPTEAEFNVNETYYPTTAFNGTTAVTFSVSPILDFAVSTPSPTPASPADQRPSKVNLYEEADGAKFVDANAQSLQDEPLLITADTQSFVAPDNLVRFQNVNRFNVPAPSLKSPAYPQFGLRTTLPSYISSRADEESAATAAYVDNDDSWLRTTSNALAPLLNDSAVRAVMNMMEEAKTNSILRNKLVLLLVNDRGQAEAAGSAAGTGSGRFGAVRDMKSKLLKALLVPASPRSPATAATATTWPYDGVTEPPVVRRRARKEGRVAVRRYGSTNGPTSLRPTESSKSMTENVISRSGRSTARPAQQVEADGDLSDTDTRAVDLLKTLYSLASTNWSR